MLFFFYKPSKNRVPVLHHVCSTPQVTLNNKTDMQTNIPFLDPITI